MNSCPTGSCPHCPLFYLPCHLPLFFPSPPVPNTISSEGPLCPLSPQGSVCHWLWWSLHSAFFSPEAEVSPVASCFQGLGHHGQRWLSVTICSKASCLPCVAPLPRAGHCGLWFRDSLVPTSFLSIVLSSESPDTRTRPRSRPSLLLTNHIEE